jgi:hypothetical protein
MRSTPPPLPRPPTSFPLHCALEGIKLSDEDYCVAGLRSRVWCVHRQDFTQCCCGTGGEVRIFRIPCYYMITSTVCGIIYFLRFILLYTAQDTQIHYNLLIRLLKKVQFYCMFYTYLTDVQCP